MLENIASERKPLKNNFPLRPFKDRPIKIACIGNCVVNKLSLILKTSPKVDAVFGSNLTNWGNYHRESLLKRAEEADMIIGLSTESNAVRHTPAELREQFPDKCVFVPLVWLDGLCSLQGFGVRGDTVIFGGDRIIEAARRGSFQQASRDFIEGDLETGMTERFEATIARMRRDEQGAITVTDFILEHYRTEMLAPGVGHPSGTIVKNIFDKVAKELGISNLYKADFTANMMGKLILPFAPRVLSPYDKERMGYEFDHDYDWLLTARSMLQLLGSRFRKEMKNAG